MDIVQLSLQSPTNVFHQLVKVGQMAMHSAAILQAENTKLRKANERCKRKKQRRRAPITNQVALQTQQG
jgi:hypothetical protein